MNQKQYSLFYDTGYCDMLLSYSFNPIGLDMLCGIIQVFLLILCLIILTDFFVTFQYKNIPLKPSSLKRLTKNNVETCGLKSVFVFTFKQ